MQPEGSPRNAAQLAELVSTVAGLAMAILNGQVDAVSSAVNTVLKRLLPVVLGFVGALVGIGGAIDKIRKVFRSIADPARKAIRGLFLRLKSLVKGLLKKVKGKGKGKKKTGEEKKKGEKFDGEIGERLTFSAGGESHAIWVNATGALPKVMMASSPKPLGEQLAPLRKRQQDLAKTSPAEATRAGELISSALSQGEKVAELAALTKQAKAGSPEQVAQDKATEKAEAGLKSTLQSLLDVLGVKKPEELTPPVVLTFNYPSKIPQNPTHADEFAGFTKKGFKDQLAGQEAGLNAMTVGQWRANRDRYIQRGKDTGSGRDPIAAALQDLFRREQRAAMVVALRLPEDERDFSGLAPAAAQLVRTHGSPTGLSADAAAGIVDRWLETQAALHDPDQVAGGSPAGLKDLGSGRINSSIGSQWGNKQASLLDQGIDSRLQNVPRPLWSDVAMKKTDNGGIRLKV